MSVANLIFSFTLRESIWSVATKSAFIRLISVICVPSRSTRPNQLKQKLAHRLVLATDARILTDKRRF